MACAGLLAIGTLGASAQNAKTGKYKIGLQLYTVRDSMAKDFEGTIKEVAKIGFAGVEFAGYYGHSAEDIKRILDENHLKCYGTHTQLTDLLGDNFEKTVKFHKIIGAPMIIVPSLPHERMKDKAAIIDTAHLFDELATKLKPYGLQIGYHNHAAEFQKVNGEYPWDIFYGNCSNNVKIQFDTGNAKSAGEDALPFLKKFPGRTATVHVKDFSATNHDALLGQGDVKFSEIIPLWKGRKAPTYFIIEQESYPEPSLVCAAKCFETFRHMMGLKD